MRIGAADAQEFAPVLPEPSADRAASHDWIRSPASLMRAAATSASHGGDPPGWLSRAPAARPPFALSLSAHGERFVESAAADRELDAEHLQRPTSPPAPSGAP